MFAKLFSCLLTLWLAGCAGSGLTPAASPPATLLQTQRTPTLRFLNPSFSDCARRQDGVGISIEERPAPALAASADIALRWGAPDATQGFIAQLGQDRLVLIVHPSSPIHELTREQVAAIFSGQAATWASFLQPACVSCPPDPSPSLAAQEIRVQAYSSGEDVQTIFEQAFDLSAGRSTAGWVPHPEAMRSFVASEPAAIGFLPARYLDASVKALSVSGAPTDALLQPILALLPAQPVGPERAWLICVQESLK